MAQRPARAADREGSVARDGVNIHYRVYGEGDGPALVLLPTWSLVPSRVWKAQVPYLARHFRVVTFDGRGSGSSDRPAGASAYSDAELVADTIAVLDAVGVPACVLVGFSRGCPWALEVALRQPSRVLGVVCIGSATRLTPMLEERTRWTWDERHDSTDGWAKYNRHYWLEGGYDDFLEFFFDQMFPEPHSTKQVEDGIGWGHEITPSLLVDTEAGRSGHLDPARFADVSCPVLVVHGSEDGIRPPAEGSRLAELTGGSLVTVVGGGHAPQARDPVVVNHLLKDFASRLMPQQPVRRTWERAASRPRRVLYLSSPIGLGHARRDLAIARSLRSLASDVEIEWLAQDPVTRVLADAGEVVHPASAWLLSESDHVDFEAGFAEHDLHAFQTLRRMDEILVANFLTFDDVVEDRHYDLVIGDEAWEVDYFLHENPELKRFAYAWLTDFVGWLPMDASESALTTDYNAEMLTQRARYRRLRDHSLFVGDPEDIVGEGFGPGLPLIREWTEQHYTFTGYITGFEPPPRQLSGSPRCLVTVGGSGAGAALLGRVLDAVPAIQRLVPGLTFDIVTGPRIDPSSLQVVPGVRLHGYLPDLHLQLGKADVVITQGGLTTCMELTAQRVPFVYVPLQHHFEQNFHVAARLDRYRAGHQLEYAEAADPDLLAEAVAKALTDPVDYLPVSTDGADRAANLLAELL